MAADGSSTVQPVGHPGGLCKLRTGAAYEVRRGLPRHCASTVGHLAGGPASSIDCHAGRRASHHLTPGGVRRRGRADTGKGDSTWPGPGAGKYILLLKGVVQLLLSVTAGSATAPAKEGMMTFLAAGGRLTGKGPD